MFVEVVEIASRALKLYLRLAASSSYVALRVTLEECQPLNNCVYRD